METSADVATVIATYNGEDHVEKCISSILRSTVDTHPIIVDNNSKDKTKDLIKSNFGDYVTLITLPSNVGWGKANNLAIEEALSSGYEYFFLLNQDAWVDKKSIEKLIDAYEEREGLGILSPVHISGEGNHFDHKFPEYICAGSTGNLIEDMYFDRPLKSVYSTDFVNGAAWLLGRTCVEQVGTFNPMFFVYGSDLNYAQRVRYHDFDVGICPHAVVHHAREDISTQSAFTDPKKKYTRETKLEVANPFDDSQHHAVTADLLSEVLKSVAKLDLESLQFSIWKIAERRRIISQYRDLSA